jgi:hypothetical protein
MYYKLDINRREALDVKIPIGEMRKRLPKLLKVPRTSE